MTLLKGNQVKPDDAEVVLEQIKHRMADLNLVVDETAADAAERIKERIAKLKEAEE